MPFDLSLGLEGTHVLVTGGDGAIGKVVVEAFLQAGACVSVFDTAVKDSDYENKSPADRNSTSKTYCNKEYNQLDIKSMQPFSNIKKYLPREVQLPQSQALPYTPPTPPINNNESPGPRPCNSQLAKYYVDVSNPAAISKGFEKAISTFGIIQVCVALAATDLSYLPHHSSVADLPFEQWQSTFNVNVHGTFLTCQQWVRQVKAHAVPSTRNLSLIIIGSESGTFGERSNPDYASGKSAVQYGLVNSLKQDIVRIHPEARVNAVAPGPVNTRQFQQECAVNPQQYYEDCQATTALDKPTSIEGVAKAIVFLASQNWSGDITGQILNVDGGKQGKLLR